MVVSLFSLRHQRVSDAREGRLGFRNFPVGESMWRLAMPDPCDRDLDSFFAILPLKNSALAVYASYLYWRESDLKSFPAALKFKKGD